MKALKDRFTAGRLLAEKMSASQWHDFIILALPRGGVPVAWEMAKKLERPWDILLVKKIAAPHHAELAIGAMAEGTQPIWNQENISWLGLSKAELKLLAEGTHVKILEQTRKWRRGREALNVKGRSVILVDDGLATGMTMLAAVDLLRRGGAERIVVAAPVASRSAVACIKEKVDDVIVLQVPDPFFSVGQWYRDFRQVDDEFVAGLLAGKVGKGIDEEVHKAVKIPAKKIILDGELSVPANSQGIVIFAHGSGSSYRSSRNQYVAQALNQIGFSTLVFDLLTPEESNLRANVFNVPLLADRLRLATNWVRDNEGLSRLSLGYFGASTGAAAALAAAAQEKNISSVVCRGGRPDLAGAALGGVNCPTLLIVGGEDHGVIELNQEAKSRLREGELVIVPGAGHLFEEPGALENVVGHASNWFLKTLVKPNIDLVAKPHQRPLGELLKMVQPIDSEESFDALLKEIRDSKVVMLGEATHGTEEFYEIRKVISKKLIEEHGFKFIAVEGDWPDCNKLNKYIQLRDTSSAKSIMSGFKRWPTWMWANEQVADLIEWMRGRGAGFYGLDIYSLYESLDLIKSYALKLNPKMEERVLEAYSCIEWFDRNDIEYAKTIIRWPHGCESEIIRNLREILRLRLEETKLFEYELFDMKQNAVIVHNAKKYCSALLYGGADSWNVRDEHMMDTLDALLQYYGDGAKGIVWAHNTHIGDYHATDMVSEGYVNLGGLARERYGMDNVSLVGFGTNEGTVLAGRAWEARAEIMNLPPAANGSYENYFHEVADQLEKKQIYVITKGLESLKLRKGHRAIGVVYQSGFETQGKNYVPTELGNRYDVFVFVDKTTSLNALPEVFEKGVIPKTWPSGF